jgi:6,7-dimethyl-8-ribityllumazine synthase
MTKILIVRAVFYQDLADMLLAGAIAALDQAKIPYEVVDVPGCFEIPAAIAMAQGTDNYDAYIALGAVIKGETDHYDYVCSECARGINHLAMVFESAIGFGVLTTQNKEQAIKRADPKQKNKGAEAAITAITMLNLKNKFIDETKEGTFDDFI